MMQKNFQEHTLQEAARLANSPAGQQLLNMLRDAGRLEEASCHAKAGDYAKAMQSVKDILSSEQGKQLLKQLGR